MRFNSSKCKVMRVSRKRNPGKTNYQMKDSPLEEVKENKYLGVIIQNNLKWDRQSSNAATKVTQMLNFLKRNFSSCSRTVKENLFKTIVQPHLEYASSAWNPGTKKNRDLLQKVQRRAARFVLGDFTPRSSVTKMPTTLKWDNVERRRLIQRLTTLHKMINAELDIPLGDYIQTRGKDQEVDGHMTNS